MAKKFSELRRKMSPERRECGDTRTRKLLDDMSIMPVGNKQMERWHSTSMGFEHSDPASFDFKILSLVTRVWQEEEYTERNWQECNRRGVEIERLRAALKTIRDETADAASDVSYEIARDALESTPSEEEDGRTMAYHRGREPGQLTIEDAIPAKDRLWFDLGILSEKEE